MAEVKLRDGSPSTQLETILPLLPVVRTGNYRIDPNADHTELGIFLGRAVAFITVTATAIDSLTLHIHVHGQVHANFRLSDYQGHIEEDHDNPLFTHVPRAKVIW